MPCTYRAEAITTSRFLSCGCYLQPFAGVLPLQPPTTRIPPLMQAGAQLGSYRVLERIGHGGMGEVWLAEHALLKRRAAIKLLRPTISHDQEMVTRFFNEARAATAISDPGIVQIFDFGHHDDVA